MVAIAESKTVRDVLAESGCLFRVEGRPTYFQQKDGLMGVVEGKTTLVRTDREIALSVVGGRYSISQVEDTIGPLFDPLVKSGHVVVANAKEFRAGRRIAVQAKLQSSFRVKGSDDVVEKYFTALKNFDQSSPEIWLRTAIRVVCVNTFNAALREGRESGFVMRHTGDMKAKMEAAGRALLSSQKWFAEYEQMANALASKPVGREQLESILSRIFPLKAVHPEMVAVQSAHAEKVYANRARVAYLFDAGKGQDIPQIRHTGWAAWNALTQWSDHERPIKGRSALQKNERRAELAPIGAGSDWKTKALNVVREVVGLN